MTPPAQGSTEPLATGRLVSRPPRHPALRGLVGTLWASPAGASQALAERVLPTGTMHLAFRLADEPLRLLTSEEDRVGFAVGTAIVGGARAGAYLRDLTARAPTVGAQLLPGSSFPLLGVPAVELAGAHTELELVVGALAGELRERLFAEPALARRLDLFEAALVGRLQQARLVGAGLAHAIRHLARGGEVGAAVAASGVSHRHFVARFREAVGLPPKLFARVARFQRLLQLLAAEPPRSFAALAFEAGYADQAHLAREFRELAGITPGRYRAVAPAAPNHVPLEVKFVQDPDAPRGPW